MDEELLVLKNTLQDALDELSSPRSSAKSKFQALQTLEHQLALVCVPKDKGLGLDNFNALQYTFECNIPLRLLAWISISTSSLEVLTNKGTMDDDMEIQASTLSNQLALALSLIQGVSLNHPTSKIYLGRKYALEVLLDLLLASRHLSSISSVPNPTSSRAPPPPLLTSTVLDTLLCILVDSPSALRTFEASGGVQAVVKILKRAGTPREVRMKCLEFLYFYLLDENPTSVDGLPPILATTSTPIPTAPNTPHRPSKPFISSRPLRPSSQLSPASFITSTSSASSSSRSTSGSSTKSFSSISSNGSSSTTPSSVSSSPDKVSAMPPLKTPPNSPPHVHKKPQHLQLQPRSLMMLRKDVDFVPLSPKKAQVSRLGVGGSSRHAPKGSISRSRLGSEDDVMQRQQSYTEAASWDIEGSTQGTAELRGVENIFKTTEEKKELLGTMLGNVDALVEGVRKAGIWGLG